MAEYWITVALLLIACAALYMFATWMAIKAAFKIFRNIPTESELRRIKANELRLRAEGSDELRAAMRKYRRKSAQLTALIAQWNAKHGDTRKA